MKEPIERIFSEEKVDHFILLNICIFVALADVVTEFLEIISHTVLFNYSAYPAELFDTASYGDILIHVSVNLERSTFFRKLHISCI